MGALHGFGYRETLVVIGHDVDLGTLCLAHRAYHGDVGITQRTLTARNPAARSEASRPARSTPISPSPQLLEAGIRLGSPPSRRTRGKPQAFGCASQAAMSMPAIAIPVRPVQHALD
jgi:hypothetical protein